MNAKELVERYVAVWNEPDETLRRAAVAALWAEDGAHITPSVEIRGHDAIAERISRAFDRFIGNGKFMFRAIDNVDSHHRTVKFNWIMVPAGGGMADSVGIDFFILDEEGRIRADYQFIEH